MSLFSAPLRILWAVIACATLISQVIPLPPWTPLPLYTYVAAKALLLVLTGFVTPMAFWRFNNLFYGVAFSAAGTIIAEAVQFGIAGHRTRSWELIGKLILIFIGFAVSLEIRHDRPVKHG